MNDASGNLWKSLGISAWLINRRRRRLWVAVTYGGWLVVAAVVRLLDLSAPDWPRTTVILLIANSTALLLWLGRSTYTSSPSFGYPEFDERMVQVKNEAFRLAYRVLGLSVFAAGMLTVAALSAQPGDQAIADGFVIWFGLLLLIALLPTTIVAWREPDLEEESA